MPIVGYVVVFNTHITDWFKTTLPIRDVVNPGFWDNVYNDNMTYLYFGLLVFGIGVALFSAFAPNQVRRFVHVDEYVKLMDSIATRNMTIGSFDRVTSSFFHNLSEEQQSGMYDQDSNSFPDELSADLHRLISEIVESSDVLTTGEFFTGSGHLESAKVLETVYSVRRVEQVFGMEVYDGAFKRRKDVFYLEHKMLDFSKPWVRAFVFLFYIVGLFLLAVPTIATSALIITNW